MSLIVYGARCAWWDDIKNIGKKPNGLPCCPHCGSVLFQMEKTQWNEGATKYEIDGHPGYLQFISWWKGRCFPSIQAACAAYLNDHPDLPDEVKKWLKKQD